MSAANEVKQQLHMMHNPFSSATSQPKIPDGKATKSLGFAQQSVEEFSGTGEVELLIFPGLNACTIIKGLDSPTPIGNRTFYIPRFQGANVANWDDAVDSSTPFNVAQLDNYAYWRHVSVGVQMKLLNPVDEDDGWWEAIRLTAELDNNEWMLTTVDNSTDRLNAGVMAPVNQLFVGVNNNQIANEPSYSTGLLRDLNRVQFELHTIRDQSEFIHMPDDLRLAANALAGVDVTTDFQATFESGHENVRDLIEKFSDTNLDMLYIKLHCNTTNGSRFHLNQVMNTEVIFDPSERESRFQTRSHNIGTGAASIHQNARRADGNAANMVVE